MWQPGWEGAWGRMDTCICTAESLHCSRETITTLSTGYTTVQNKRLKKVRESSKKQSFKNTSIIISQFKRQMFDIILCLNFCLFLKYKLFILIGGKLQYCIGFVIH